MANQIGPFRGYSVFDALMRQSISEEMSASRLKQRETAVQQASGTASATGRKATERIYGTSTRPTGDFSSPFMADTSNFGRIDGQVVDLSKNPELRSAQGMERISNAKAGAKAVTGTTGLRNYGKAGRVGLGVLSALDPTPFSAISGFMGGTTGVDPYGKTTFRPTGVLGLVAEYNIEKQYDVAQKIKEGTPGYHQFYSGNRLVSLTPQTIGGKKLGYAVTGTTDLSSEQAIAQYSTMFGYDPATVDLEKRPGDAGFGQELGGFIPGVGGVGTDGRFVDTLGNRQGSPRDTNAYLGMVNDVYGQSAALDAAQSLGLGQEYNDAITSGLLTSKEYMNPDGTVAGYGTGTGGIVTTTDGAPVRGGSGYVSYGTGYKTPEQMQELAYQGRTSQTYGTSMLSEQSRMLADQDRDFRDDNAIDTVEGFTTRSGRDDDGRDDRDPGDLSEPGGPPDQGLGPDRGASDTFFAEGGLAGEVAGEPVPEEAPVANGPGFVEERPEELPEGMTVADDVPLDVPEGTFVINAAAVEFAGSSDVKTMILEALAEAEKQGLDIEQQNSTIPKEELVSLVVSRGEVIIPPQLAEIIGYDRLNKINNRGKAEVAKRQAEAEAQQEQAQQEPQPQDPNVRAAATGGDTREMVDLNDVIGYRDFKNPQSSFLNMLEVTGAMATGNLDAMEKAFSYSRRWNQATKSGDNYEDTMRHALVGGLYGDVGGFYADAKEQYHKYLEGYGKIGYEKAKGMLGIGTDPEQTEIARNIIGESEVDLNNNAYGRELRKRVPDEEQYVRTLERMMYIARDEGFEALPALVTEDGEEIRLQLSTVRPE